MKVSDYLGFLKSNFDLESKSVEYGAKTEISRELKRISGFRPKWGGRQ